MASSLSRRDFLAAASVASMGGLSLGRGVSSAGQVRTSSPRRPGGSVAMRLAADYPTHTLAFLEEHSPHV